MDVVLPLNSDFDVNYFSQLSCLRAMSTIHITLLNHPIVPSLGVILGHLGPFYVNCKTNCQKSPKHNTTGDNKCKIHHGEIIIA